MNLQSKKSLNPVLLPQELHLSSPLRHIHPPSIQFSPHSLLFVHGHQRSLPLLPHLPDSQLHAPVHLDLHPLLQIEPPHRAEVEIVELVAKDLQSQSFSELRHNSILSLPTNVIVNFALAQEMLLCLQLKLAHSLPIPSEVAHWAYPIVEHGHHTHSLTKPV